MSVCVECDKPFDARELPHAWHEPDCVGFPSCRCDGFVHPVCCRVCSGVRI